MAPVACSMRGKWVAIAVLMNHVAANTKASRAVASPCGPGRAAGRVPSCAAGASGLGVSAATALGSQAFNGRPIIKCKAAQPRHAPRQPNSVSIQAESGQPTVLAKPAISVIPVMAPRA
ncbi:Uncharacterised protein [Bordetella pertussis]|nr:Uncharacterised protein [Bordetella pertussis]